MQVVSKSNITSIPNIVKVKVKVKVSPITSHKGKDLLPSSRASSVRLMG
jgi:hypothetical protein